MRAFGLAALALAASAAAPAAAQTTPTSSRNAEMTRLTVSVSGNATSPADRATVMAGVTTRNPDSRVAASDNANVMSRLFAALEAAGVARADIATASLTLSPTDRYGDSEAAEMRGFTASNQVTVTVRDLSKLSDILGTLYANGANNVNSPVFGIADRAPLTAQARRDAIALATREAEAYAEGFGMRVDHILRISEGGVVAFDFDSVMSPPAMLAEGAVSPPVSGPTVTVTVGLGVEYALAPR